MLQSHWVACTTDDRWLKFPAKVDGWGERSPYTGGRDELREVAAWSAFNTGFPHPDAKLRSTPPLRAMAACMAA
jgi:hypothetical protein